MNDNVFGGREEPLREDQEPNEINDFDTRNLNTRHQFQLSDDFDSRVIDVNDLYNKLNKINDKVLDIVNMFKSQVGVWEVYLSSVLSSGATHVRDYALMQKVTTVINNNEKCMRLLNNWYTNISEKINSCFEYGLKYAELLSNLRNLCRNEISEFGLMMDSDYTMAKSKISKAKSIQSFRSRLYKLDNKINSTVSTLKLQLDMFQRGFISLDGKTINLNSFIDCMDELSGSSSSSLQALRSLIVNNINLQNLPVINYQNDNNIRSVLQSLTDSLSGAFIPTRTPRVFIPPQPQMTQQQPQSQQPQFPQSQPPQRRPPQPPPPSSSTTQQSTAPSNASNTTTQQQDTQFEVQDSLHSEMRLTPELLQARSDALMANIDETVPPLPLRAPDNINASILELQQNFISTQHNVKRLKKWYANLVQLGLINDAQRREDLVEFINDQIRNKQVLRVIGELRAFGAQSTDKFEYINRLRNHLRFMNEAKDSAIYQDLENMLAEATGMEG